MRWILLLLVIAGVAAYFTNPKEAAFVEPARVAAGNVGEAQLEDGNIGEAIESGLEHVGGTGEFKNMYLFSTYAMPTAADPTVRCWGAFTQVQCSAA